MFIRNVSQNQKQNIYNILQVLEGDDNYKYLGLPCVIERRKKEAFRYI